MKNTFKFLIKLNPNYINKLKEEDLDEDIVLYALERGFKYQNDINHRYCKYFGYVIKNLSKDSKFISYLIFNTDFNFSYFKEVEMQQIIDYIFSNNCNLLIDCIDKDENFVKYLNSLSLEKIDKTRLYGVLVNKVEYDKINKEVLFNNNELALSYLNEDFSNIKKIVNFINISNVKENILNIFEKDLEHNIKYLDYISVLLDENYQKKDEIIDILKYESIIITEKTPKFIFDNKYSTYNILINNIEKSNLIPTKTDFNNEQQDEIIKLIKDKNIIFEEIPIVFSERNSNRIVEQIMNNNPHIIDSENFKIYSDMQYKYIYNLIMEDKYLITNNTNLDLLGMLLNHSSYLISIMKKDFSLIKYFNNINLYLNIDSNEEIYKICKDNNYALSKDSPKFLKNNFQLVMDALENGYMKLSDFDLNLIVMSKKNKVYLINYCIKNNILDNEIINNWRKNLINDFSVSDDKSLYIKNIYGNILLPNDITEVYLESKSIDDINRVIELVKKSDCNVKKIVVDLPYDTFDLNYLNSITDKDIVFFRSKNDITRFSVNDLINLEKTMDLMVKDIKESNLSSYEKYIAVYDIVRSFKEYQYYQDSMTQDRKNSDQSRSVYLILVNDWMVCVGYSNLLVELLKRVGINAMEWEVTTKNDNHSRTYINIVDSKYGIDGYYMCDSTWDSIQKDIILSAGSHMNMTTAESNNTDNNEFDFTKDNVLNDKLFRINNKDEMLDYLKQKASQVKNIIESLDPGYYKNIKERFNNIDQSFANELFNYISSKINNPISIKNQASAVIRVKDFVDGVYSNEKQFEEKYNDYIIKNMLGYENLTYNYEKDLSIESSKILGLSLPEYNQKYKLLEKKLYKRNILSESFYKIINTYLPEYNRNYFGLSMKDNKIFFTITFGPLLFKDKEKSSIIFDVLSKKYKCKIGDWSDNISFMLDDEYNNMTIKNLLDYCKLIRNDFINFYNQLVVVDDLESKKTF